MKLVQVLDTAVPSSAAEVDITSVQIDSRHCTPGALFFAMPGASFDGTRFSREAVQLGAVAVVTSAALDVTVPCIVVEKKDLHSLLVGASAAITGHAENDVTLVGVTGTNGKTSVTTVLAALWRALGHHANVVGTLTHERTTPAPPELFREIESARRNANQNERALLALEVSSHALTQGRVDGLRFAVAAFTNLSLDHLDYHGSMEEYFNAKAQLFDRARCQHAVIWIDDPYGERLARQLSVPVTLVSPSDASNVTLAIGETTFSWRGQHVRTSLSGQYNLDNSLIVLAIAVALGASARDAAHAISASTSVPGRFEVVSPSSPTVIVDYAHTPDGLQRLLQDVRSLTKASELTVVFGCGGDRDRSKRSLMGEISTRLADRSIFTSDNPRSENPELIIDEIASGAVAGSSWQRISDRRAAIAEALREVNERSVVVIAGKGHETTQSVGDEVLPFDDRVVARELLAVGS